MMRARAGLFATKLDMQMTPMIDVVFQLLIFFMLTYRPRLTETAFLIALPAPGVQAQAASADDPTPDPLESLLPDIPIRLRADGQGRLVEIVMGNRPLASVAELRAALETFLHSVEGRAREKVKVEIEPDASLRYEFIVEVIGAATAAGIERVDLGQPRSTEDTRAPPPGAGS